MKVLRRHLKKRPLHTRNTGETPALRWPLYAGDERVKTRRG